MIRFRADEARSNESDPFVSLGNPSFAEASLRNSAKARSLKAYRK